ncbi:MAG: hypothetical protein K1X72_04290 [Pyrinomonadaceae bacterium]|nr:hypothetical protein [Pyrinomonadaceae bacterium]
MAKRGYALSTGAGLFVDEETGLKVVPGEVVEIDLNEAGHRTQQAIRFGGLIEADLPKKGKEKGDSEPPKE